MIRIRNTVASVLGALVVLGASSVASAQSNAMPNQNTPTGNLTPQEHLDRDKVTLKDQVQDQINTADANIDALKKLSDTDKGATKKNDETLQKHISDLRDHLKDDLSKIDNASMQTWPNVKATVLSDYNALDAQLKVASNITHVPTTGAANKQPANP